MSRQQLATTLAVTLQQVDRYERGGGQISARLFYELSRALDVPVSFFFDDHEHAEGSPRRVTAPSGLDQRADRKTLGSALRVLLAAVELADGEAGIDDDQFEAAKLGARAALGAIDT